MTKNEILKTQKRIIVYLEQKRLSEAFAELKNLADGAMVWEISNEVSQIEDSYKMMLNYAMQGVEDPARITLYNDIINNIYYLLDRVVRQRLSSQESTLYYSTLRYEQMQPNDSIFNLIESYNAIVSKVSIYNLLTTESATIDSLKIAKEKEQIERRIFNRIWVTFPLNSEDEETLKGVLLSNSYPQECQELILSALLLGLLEFYDVRRMRLLLNAYGSELQNVSIKALVAILLSISRYHKRINDIKLLNQIDSIKEIDTWSNDVKTAYLELVKTRDTERISRKMQDELIPEMLKLRPDLYKKLNDSTAMIDMSSIEENPEWEEILQNSGITDKIKELNQLQEEGSDVFMSTFSHLKSFPFFSEISNWFMPFTRDYSLVSDTLGNESTMIADVIDNAPYLCNSDKYSFLLSLGSIPQQQRQLMLSQFEQQRQAMNEAGLSMSAMIQPTQRKTLMNKYLQDLYRFFKLFRRKGEFYDPFNTPINLVNVSLLSGDLDDVETLSIIGEFYFKRKYYSEARDVYMSILEKMPPSAQLFQKIGYCYHQENDIKNALKYYEQAELLNADSLWTLRRIAACYRSIGNPQKALEYYHRVAFVKPDDLNVALNIGHCYLELGNYNEAIKNYYKVEFLDDKSTRAWRPLAWSLLLIGDYDQSQKYYEKIIIANPIAEDYLNMGHLALAKNEMQLVVENYKRYIEMSDGDVNALIQSLKQDEKYLLELGVDSSLLPFVVDAILYSID